MGGRREGLKRTRASVEVIHAAAPERNLTPEGSGAADAPSNAVAQDALDEVGGIEQEQATSASPLRHAIGRVSILPRSPGVRLSRPDDPEEREAEQVADSIVRQSPSASESSAGIESSTAGAHGQPLDPTTRSFMQARFGHDFSRVRVHTGSEADQSARSINARAFTIGDNIAFGAGQYAPFTHEGGHLLAHELTHVVQQSSGTTSGVAYRAPTDVADPTLIPLPSVSGSDAVERNWSAEIKPIPGPSTLAPIQLFIDASVPKPPDPIPGIKLPWDPPKGPPLPSDQGPAPLGGQFITREVAWNTMRNDLKRFESIFNEMVPVHNNFFNAQNDKSLTSGALIFQLPAKSQPSTLPEAAAKQAVPGGAKGQTVNDVFSGNQLAKAGDPKELESMKESDAIKNARAELKKSEQDLAACLADAKGATGDLHASGLELRDAMTGIQLDEKKEELEQQKGRVEQLKQKAEAAKKVAEMLIDITQGMVRAGLGDEEGAKDAAKGGIKLGVAFASELVVLAMYGSQLTEASNKANEIAFEVKKIGKTNNDQRLETLTAKIKAARDKLDAAQKRVKSAETDRQNKITLLGQAIGNNTQGSADPEERKRIGALFQALPIVELVASRAAELRAVTKKSEVIGYTMASGIGFGMLTKQKPDVATKFITNCDIFHQVLFDAVREEKDWTERANSIRAMVDQIGQGPGLPSTP
jgi:uncharacterized protein DUF4157